MDNLFRDNMTVDYNYFVKTTTAEHDLQDSGYKFDKSMASNEFKNSKNKKLRFFSKNTK